MLRINQIFRRTFPRRVVNPMSYPKAMNQTLGFSVRAGSIPVTMNAGSPFAEKPTSTTTTNPSTKTQRRRTRTLPDSIPSLSGFLASSKYKVLYRRFVRAALKIDDLKERGLILNEVRGGFQVSKVVGMEDEDINLKYKQGLRELKMLEQNVGVYSYDLHDPKINEGKNIGWMDIKDEEDERGRVGTSWPWDKK